MSLRVSILIPVFNEARTVEMLIDKVREVPIEKEIVCVDDACPGAFVSRKAPT